MGTEYATARNSKEKRNVTKNVATIKTNVNYTLSRQARVLSQILRVTGSIQLRLTRERLLRTLFV